MKYLSVCSGIEAASCAWRGLGWQAAAYSEIEPFPCAVLNHHFPDTPNWGDMTKWKDWPDATIDLLVGGTPCQSFSTAGLRKGLDDIRGQLAIGFSSIAERYRPKWIVWENVPGVLSSGGGRDFSAFCQSLVKLGYGLCWRVLDAQHFGVPQRRRRVFVIGYLGNWRHSAAVLFEPESLCGNSKKGRKKGEGTTRNAGFGAATSGSYWDGGQLSQTLDAVLAKGQTMPEKNRFPAVLVPVVPPLTARMAKGRCTDGQDEQAGYPHLICMAHGQAGAEIATNRSTTLTCLHEAPIVAQAFTVAEARRTGTIELKDQAPTLTSQTKRGDTEPCVIAFPERMSGTQRATTEDLCPALGAKNPTAVAFHATRRDGGRILGDLSPTVEAHWGTGGGNVPNVSQSMQVRRLTPRECERLQGFPDDWTNVSRNGKPAPDGPRYKAIGNSMAVPCMYWLGKRIALVEEIINGGRNGQKH